MKRNNRRLIALGGIFAMFGIVFFIGGQKRANLDETGGFIELVEGQLSTEDVYGLHVSKGEGDGFQMVKRGDDWFLSSHHDAPANENKLRSLLGNLETASGEVRSTSDAVFADYSLEDSTALHIVLNDESGAETLHLLIGKRSGQGGFVRRGGSHEVLRADHNFLSDFGVWGETITAPQATSWMDLAVFSAQRDSVQSVELEWSDGKLSMSKELQSVEEPDSTAGPVEAAPAGKPEYEWRVSVPSNFLAKKTTADGILGSLCNLRARDIAAKYDDTRAEEWGLGEDCDRATLHLANGQSSTLLFGAALEGEDNQIYFRVDGEELVWTLPSYLKTNIFKDPATLKPE